jgi:branched-chain amino acid transport system permease protein
MDLFSEGAIESILIVAGYTAVITLGQYVSMSGGSLSVAHAAMAGSGAYVGGLITSRSGAPLVVAIAAGMVVGFTLGTLLGFLSVRLHPLVAGLMTLAFAEVMVVVALNLDIIGGANGLSGVPLYTELWVVVLILLAVLVGVWRYDTSRLGIAARACRDDVDGAAAIGINVSWVKSVTFGIGSAIAALGGVLAIHYISVETPHDLGFFQGLNYLIFAIFGGSYLVWGALFGSLSLSILPEFLRFSDTDRYVLYGLVLAIVVILRPEGLIRRQSGHGLRKRIQPLVALGWSVGKRPTKPKAKP